MSSRPVRRLRTAGLILAALVGSIVLVSPTSAAPPKYFDATVTGSIPAGATTDVTLTITNVIQNKIEFDGVRITIPTGLALGGSVTAVTTDGLTPVRVTETDSKYIEFADSNVGKDEALTVTIPVAAPCANPTYSWDIDVRQSNSFNGTDNKFDPLYLNALKTTSVTGSCLLRFGGQPADADPGAFITAIDFAPADPAKVTVEVLDGAGAVADVDGLAVNLTARVAASNAEASGFTGLSAQTTNGIATFSLLKSELSTAPNTYEFVAGATGYTSSPESASFRIVQRSTAQQCTNTPLIQSDDFFVGTEVVGCSTGVIEGANGETAKIELFDGDGLAGSLTGSFSAATTPDCPYYVEDTNQLSFNVTITGGTPTSAMYKRVSLTKRHDGRDVYDYQVCFEAPYWFPALVLTGGSDTSNLDQLLFAVSSGSFSAQGPVAGQYKGLLLPCQLVAAPEYEVEVPGITGKTAPPRIVSRVVSGTFPNEIVTIVVKTPATDPAMRF